MSGHSKWSTIKHKKGAADAKRGKLFTKLGKEIAVAAKLGDPNPEFNPRLRSAIITARANNMPKDKIESAIKRATSAGESESYSEMRYEGYGPSGVALIVEALTDNKNRTASSVRSLFSKSGGSMGETGSVAYMFDKVGLIGYEGSVASEDEMFEVAVEAGADSIESSEDWHEIATTPENFSKVRDILIKKYGDPKVAKLGWKPKNLAVIRDTEKAEKVLRLVEKLEDDDDVQSVTGNFDIPDEILNSIK